MQNYGLTEIIIFSIIVIVCLLLDLFTHKKDAPISIKNAAMWSIFWIGVSLIFATYIGYSHSPEDAKLFIAGYALEKSLSVDNLFVFLAIFSSFYVKNEYQHRVLYYGIVGAIVLRLIFVLLGSALLSAGGAYVMFIFGIFVLYSAFKMFKHSGEGHKEEVDYSKHKLVSLVQKILPVHDKLVGHDFFVKIDGVLKMTPLFLCLIIVEVADVMFAFDSVPAVFAITNNPFIVFTSNIFAILGLRSMYFLLAAAKNALCHLEKAVIFILAFVGIKMLLLAFEGPIKTNLNYEVHISPTFSLSIVLGALAVGIVASLMFPDKKEV